MGQRIFVAALLLLALFDAQAGRSFAARAAFVKSQPCPSTGKTHGACPGWVVDHIQPLCAGGPDHKSNMQWQSFEEAKKKDRVERKACRNR